jgi:hypothetical protein
VQVLPGQQSWSSPPQPFIGAHRTVVASQKSAPKQFPPQQACPM